MNSKRKGAAGERELAKVLRGYGYDCRRGCQYHGGEDSPDVVGLDGIHIECKRTEHLRLYEALDQAKRDAGKNIPVVMYRRNDSEWVAVMRLEDFMRMYRDYER